MHFKKNRPIVAPVAPTNANRNGSSEASNTKNDERIIQVGGIKIGAAFTAINRKNMPRQDYSIIVSKISAMGYRKMRHSKTLKKDQNASFSFEIEINAGGGI